MKMPRWEFVFCIVAKVPGVGNKVIVSTLTAIRGESWCNLCMCFSSSITSSLCMCPQRHRSPNGT